MRQGIPFTHKFVEFIPEQLEEKTLYVSIRFATIAHLCPCGCKSKVVTPIKPTDWRLTFDGKTISLDPSIGNWSFPCRSHYWIKNNTVRWAEPWSQTRIKAAKAVDRCAKEKYYNVAVEDSTRAAQSEGTARLLPVKIAWWRRFWRW
jgi:hypothetical protein